MVESSWPAYYMYILYLCTHYPLPLPPQTKGHWDNGYGKTFIYLLQ